MVRLGLIVMMLALAGCSAARDAVSANAKVAGTAAGQTLTVDRLAQVVGRAQRIPIQPDVLTGVANVYLDYALFAAELGRGRDMHDSALVLAVAKRGLNFAQLARRYSEDPGTKTKGGYLPATPRGQFVPAFDSAAWLLAQGAMTAVVRTPFGFHIIRRPPLAEVRDSFHADLENVRAARFDSLYLDSLANQRQLKAVSGAPALVRQAVPQIVSARSDTRTLATYKGGTFQVKDLARWLLALDPNDVRGIATASDAQLNQFLKVLAQREMLLVEVDKAGKQLNPDDWRQLRAEHDSAVARLEAQLGLSPELLKDSAATPAARVQLAMAHVDRYVDQAVTRGSAPFFPVPAFLASALRQGQPWSLNEAGIARAVESAQAIRAADTTAQAAPPTGLKRAPGPPPVAAESGGRQAPH